MCSSLDKAVAGSLNGTAMDLQSVVGPATETESLVAEFHHKYCATAHYSRFQSIIGSWNVKRGHLQSTCHTTWISSYCLGLLVVGTADVHDIV